MPPRDEVDAAEVGERVGADQPHADHPPERLGILGETAGVERRTDPTRDHRDPVRGVPRRRLRCEVTEVDAHGAVPEDDDTSVVLRVVAETRAGELASHETSELAVDVEVVER